MLRVAYLQVLCGADGALGLRYMTVGEREEHGGTVVQRNLRLNHVVLIRDVTQSIGCARCESHVRPSAYLVSVEPSQLFADRCLLGGRQRALGVIEQFVQPWTRKQVRTGLVKGGGSGGVCAGT